MAFLCTLIVSKLIYSYLEQKVLPLETAVLVSHEHQVRRKSRFYVLRQLLFPNRDLFVAITDGLSKNKSSICVQH